MPARLHEVLASRGQLLTRLPAWVQTLVVALLLAACWLLVYGAGGTRTAFPHVFYLPIVLAALPFGVAGGLTAGVAAAVLCGPLMPLDVATGESQQLVNWLIRGGFFTTVGGLAGTSTVSLRRSFQAGLSRQLQRELDLATTDGPIEDEGGWQLRVRRVLDDGGLRVVFQPIFTLDDGRLFAVEALARFDAEPRQRPDMWFARAAQVGLGVELELAAIEAALEASTELPTQVALSFNASPGTLADQRLLRLLDRHAGRQLIAEVTEHAVVDDYRHLETCLVALRSRGVRVAVDDAGAGFASLRHIVRLQPDYIKLDPSLTQDLGDDPVRRPLADCLVQFALRTDSAILVEGIETAADLAAWQDLGAHAAQGYLLGQPGPLPAAPLAEALQQAGSYQQRLRSVAAGADARTSR
jgi:EAL domain-containing protein (putative c-di-GMP-specific phosphodiesterase class I)